MNHLQFPLRFSCFIPTPSWVTKSCQNLKEMLKDLEMVIKLRCASMRICPVWSICIFDVYLRLSHLYNWILNILVLLCWFFLIIFVLIFVAFLLRCMPNFSWDTPRNREMLKFFLPCIPSSTNVKKCIQRGCVHFYAYKITTWNIKIPRQEIISPKNLWSFSQEEKCFLAELQSMRN